MKKIVSVLTAVGISCLSSAWAASTPAEFYDELYTNMVNRNESFVINYEGNYEDVFDGSLDKLFQEVGALHREGNSSDFDYLYWNIDSGNVQLPEIGANNRFNFTIKYREPKAWLEQVNKDVARVLPELNQGTTVERIKNMHDYVINRIAYDETLTRYTAFEGLEKQSTVCQGYALLMYKLLTEAGIPVRFVSGDAGQRHGWNLVKVGTKWYFVDATWDDPISSQPILRYDYFLVGWDKLSQDHKLDEQFMTPEFLAQYPISKEDYDFNQPEQETGEKTAKPQAQGAAAEYNFDLHQEVRKAVVTSYDEAMVTTIKDAKPNEVKIIKNILDLEKQIMLASLNRLTDEQLTALIMDDKKFDRAMEQAEAKLEQEIFTPLQTKLDSPELQEETEAATLKQLESVDYDKMSKKVLTKYCEEFAEQYVWQKMQTDLEALSQQKAELLINDLYQSFL